jgi:hypothetical protein
LVRGSDEDNQAVAHALVTIYRLDGKHRPSQARLDSDGQVDVIGITPGSYTVQATAAPDLASDPQAVMVQDWSDEQKVELKLGRQRTVRGRVLSAGMPVPGAKLLIRSQKTFPLGRAVYAREDGTFSMTVPDGLAYLFVTAPGCAATIQPLMIHEDRNGLELNVDQAGGTIVLPSLPPSDESSQVVIWHDNAAMLLSDIRKDQVIRAAESGRPERISGSILEQMSRGEYRVCSPQAGSCASGFLEAGGVLELATIATPR